MTFLLAGCDLFTRNNSEYYNQTVITISYKDNSKIQISRKDFLSAYNNYGQNLISQYSYTEEQAKDATVDALVKRKVLLAEANRLAETTAGASIKLTDAQKQELRYQTYEALISNAKEYESEIKKYWNITVDDEIKEDISEDAIVYQEYEKQAKIVFDEQEKVYKIKLLKDDSLPNRNKVFADNQAIYNTFIAETKNNTSNKIAREEYRRYLASLQASQKILGTKYSEEELIKQEIERIYTNLEENEIISNYQDFKQENNGYSTITVQQVLDRYKTLISSSKFKYENDTATYNTDMLENRANVNYVINDDYFYVAHILIKFNDDQQKKYDELENLSNKGQGDIISAENYSTSKQNLYNSLKASVRDAETGEIVQTESISAKTLLSNLQKELSEAKTNKQKDKVFSEFMYKYNEDGGIMNASYPYVIGEKDDQSKMVESFTEASRELNLNGEYGAISGLVQSNYGLHIIYYMGKCQNPYTIASDGTINLRATIVVDEANDVYASDALLLEQTYLNNLHNKTVFDQVYESLVSDNYSLFENMNIATIEQEQGVKIDVVSNLI